MGTKSVDMTVKLWLSMLKIHVVSTDVLITRRMYFLPWKLSVFDLVYALDTDFLNGHVESFAWETSSKITLDRISPRNNVKKEAINAYQRH